MSPCTEFQSAIDAHLYDPEAVDLTDETALHLESCADCMAHFDSVNPPWDDFPAEQGLHPARRVELLNSVQTRSSLVRMGFGVLVAGAVAATLLLAVLPANETAVEVAAPADPTPATAVPDDELATHEELFREAVNLAEEARYDDALDALDELFEVEDLDKRLAGAGQRLYKEIEVIGAPAGDLSSIEWMVDSADLQGDELTMLIFFEEWCPHCKREMPKAEETFKEFRADGLQVVGITKGSRSGVEAATRYVDEGNFTFPIGLDETGEVSDRFNVRGIPAAALVDDGRLVWRGHPGRLTDEMLEEFLSL